MHTSAKDVNGDIIISVVLSALADRVGGSHTGDFFLQVLQVLKIGHTGGNKSLSL